MNDDYDWNSVLNGHPILSLPRPSDEQDSWKTNSNELSLDTLQHHTRSDPMDDKPNLSGRRQVMVLRETDMILAVGKEIRITSLGDSKLGIKSYKVLHTPNIQFEIRQLVLNPNNKLLAVAGSFQVAVVVMPRSGFTRLVSPIIDCKCIQIGQFYHASKTSPPIAKIEWHPWGDAGSTLLVVTVDGKLREYNVSLDPDEPQQVLSFVPERKSKSFLAEDVTEREVASFTFGKGQADWGPLTVYAVMKSGDVYSICPYLPKHASVPSSYLHNLECFISAKQQFLSESEHGTAKDLSVMYDYQRKYIAALIKQLPPGTMFSTTSQSVLVHPPTTVKSQPLRQGPFLLQPSPHQLDGSEGGNATDITYISYRNDPDDDDGECDGLGVIMIIFQDGKIDVCLDVEKVEARWESRQERDQAPPMLAVYETIDLGLVSSLNQLSWGPPVLDLLQGNYPSLLVDPIRDDTVYVYHAFGVHALHLGSMLQSLYMALREDEHGDSLDAALAKSCGTDVQPILDTFSVTRRCSSPVVGVSVPNDIYLAYGIFILTSAMRFTSVPLTLRSEPLLEKPALKGREEPSTPLVSTDSPPAYVSLLGSEPYSPPATLTHSLGLPSYARFALPEPPHSADAELVVTPGILKYLAKIVESFTAQIHDIQLAHKTAVVRMELQRQEHLRQKEKFQEAVDSIEKLKRPDAIQQKIKRLQDNQKVLFARLDGRLQSMMRKASPELSNQEKKWFEELKRLKEEISGAGRYDEGSFTARIALLKREYDRIIPGLKTALEKETAYMKTLSENSKGLLGFRQIFAYAERSNMQQEKIHLIEKILLELAGKVDLPLERPPSQNITE